jgi:hypothetical protein
VIESVFPEEGIYVGVDHNMADVVKGGAFAVIATNDATEDDHPPGTWVPGKAWLNENGSMSMEESPTGTVPEGTSGGNATSTGPTASTGQNTTSGNSSNNNNNNNTGTSSNSTTG